MYKYGSRRRRARDPRDRVHSRRAPAPTFYQTSALGPRSSGLDDSPPRANSRDTGNVPPTAAKRDRSAQEPEHREPEPRPAKRPRTQRQPQAAAGPSSSPSGSNTAGRTVVRFGSANWSADDATLRHEVRMTARAAWERLPDLFDAVTDISLDRSNTGHVLIEFPSWLLAQSFVDAWIQNKHTTPMHKRAQAHVL